jgi:hypothetical protein
MDPNDFSYSVAALEPLASAPLKGKTFYWLGSSVTLGLFSFEEGLPDYLAKHQGCTCIKEAVSGTTLRQESPEDESYLSRLLRSKKFDPKGKIDGFFIQASTNDCWDASKLGTPDSLDPKTTFGGLHAILAYVKKRWDCPVYLVSGSFYNGLNGMTYGPFIAALLERSRIDGFKVIDLWDDPVLKEKANEMALAMHDGIHPFREGYRDYWLPRLEEALKS